MPSYQHYEKRFNKSSAYGLAKAAYSTANFVKDMVNIEYKDYRIETIPVSISNLGVVYDLIGNSSGFAGIAQGTGNNDRIGDSIKLQRMVFRGLFKKASPATITGLRVIIFKGKSEAGVMYTPSNILESLNIYSGKNESFRYNTTVLYDEVHILDSVKTQYFEADWNKELNWHANFVTGTMDIGDGGLYMLLMSTEGTVANQPQWDGVFRITYTDD